MNLARIRGFLLQLPKPSAVRVTVGDGEPQIIKPGRSYVRTAETIEALGADLVECLDAQGNVIRALRLAEQDAQRSDAAEIPKGIEVDPNALMLTHFANLIHRAYEHSTEVAFQRLLDVTERLSAHSMSIEARLAQTEGQLRRAQTDQLDEALERAQEALATGQQPAGNDFLQQMAMGWLQGRASTAAAAPPPPARNGKSNGKA
jgi:hypothetical protein